MNRAILLGACFVVFSAIAGCLPATKIVKNPGVHDKGLRYYRPKPYLMIKPLMNGEGEPVEGYVSIEEKIMPDYSEEYSIHIKTGLGTNHTQVALTDGWRLDSLNVNLDSNFDDNLKAFAEVAKAIPALTSEKMGRSSMAVRATNVPLGLYEAVISKSCNGTKRLYGFRYVGFMPYASCPLESCGYEQTDCGDGQVYGLTMEDGSMVFRPLYDLSNHTNLDRIRIVEEPDLIDDEGDPLDDAASVSKSRSNSLYYSDMINP